ncbi:hypothetical protein IB276_18425 [Ensifer sp. ENS04]|uniref:hypothetical protein n=1 Tax=Ensifer sp. ENS04 TaxID=2769281 RepID=UPI0017813B98|nr:hypothetical protein [Ensifer sp. ENS04]MBD9541433.1 hypothetical protein [Ensifer sp. ENS04]
MAFERLNNLVSALRVTNHDFKASTEIFPQVDVDRIAKEMNLLELAQARGSQEQPATTAAGYDDVELSVISRIQDAKNTAHHNLEDQLHLFTERLVGLDFQGQFSDLEKVSAETISEFKAEVIKGKGILHGPRRDLIRAHQELKDFQARHGITRAPRGAEGGRMFLKISLLILFFFGEWIANGFFLSKGNEMGIVGGVMEALVFSLLNIGVALFYALFGLPLLTYRSKLVVLGGLLAGVAYLAFTVVLNLVLAHYREVAGNLVDGAGLRALTRFWINPLGLEDLHSWMLFATGLLLSVLTVVDGYFMRDPYIGYAGVNQRRDEAEDFYLSQQARLIDQLIEVRNTNHQQVEQIVENLSGRRREHNAIIAHRTKLLALFSEYQDHLDRSTNQLLRKYRDANISARKTPAPKYFDTAYKFTRIKPTRPSNAELTDKQISEAVKKAQEGLSSQIKAIAAACEDGINEYRELDILFPDAETANG